MAFNAKRIATSQYFLSGAYPGLKVTFSITLGYFPSNMLTAFLTNLSQYYTFYKLNTQISVKRWVLFIAPLGPFPDPR